MSCCNLKKEKVLNYIKFNTFNYNYLVLLIIFIFNNNNMPEKKNILVTVARTGDNTMSA